MEAKGISLDLQCTSVAVVRSRVKIDLEGPDQQRSSEPKAGSYVCVLSIRQISNTKGSHKETRKQQKICLYLYTVSLRS